VSHKLTELFERNNARGCSEAELKEVLSRLTGHFSFILDSPDFTLVVVDKIRSQPIYYSVKTAILYVSNSASKLQTVAGVHEKYPDSVLEFEMAGYTIGRKTLYKDLFQLQAGEFLIFDKRTGEIKLDRYYRFWSDEKSEKSDKDLLSELGQVVDKTFSKMIQSLQGAPVCVPLSGGLDSRFILAMFKEFNYDNLFTYTYGVKGLWEVKRAKYIADSLDVKWHYIEFDPKETKKLFHSLDREKYYGFAGGLNSIPHLAEYYALLRLKEEQLVPENAVIINGQTGDFLTGGHIPKTVLTQNTTVHDLVSDIIDKHFSLWTNLKTVENRDILSRNIRKALNLTGDGKLSKERFANHFETFEWQERQAKYVTNGQRAYEWLGYGWRLPLWSDELMEFWQKIDWERKFSQRLYKKFLNEKNLCGLFKTKLPREYSYMPFWVKVFRGSVAGLGLLLTKDFSPISSKYSRYFMTYAPFYPQTSYRAYLRDSKWHRSPVSYWVKHYLREVAK